MESYTWKRLVYTVWLFTTPFLLPWWGVGIFVLIGITQFNRYYEVIAVGVLMDMLFGFLGDRWYVTGIHTVIFTSMFIIGIFAEKVLARPKLWDRV